MVGLTPIDHLIGSSTNSVESLTNRKILPFECGGIYSLHRVDDVDYEADSVLYGIMIGTVFLTALLTTAGISFLVDGATWSVSTGIGNILKIAID